MAPLPLRFKAVLVGDGRSGKSSLAHTFCVGNFPDPFFGAMRVEDRVVELKLDGKTIELVLTVTYSQDEYKRIRPLAYNGVDVVLLCFSFDVPDSLVNISEKWIFEVKEHCPTAAIILVGCKADLRRDPLTIEDLRMTGETVVTPEAGQAAADALKAYTYVECSAKGYSNVDTVFEQAIRAALAKTKKPSRVGCVMC